MICVLAGGTRPLGWVKHRTGKLDFLGASMSRSCLVMILWMVCNHKTLLIILLFF